MIRQEIEFSFYSVAIYVIDGLLMPWSLRVEYVYPIWYEKVLEKQLGSRSFNNFLVGLGFQVNISVRKLVQIWIIFSNWFHASCGDKGSIICRHLSRSPSATALKYDSLCLNDVFTK